MWILSLSLFHLPYTYQLLNIIEKSLCYSFGEVLGEIGGVGGSSVHAQISMKDTGLWNPFLALSVTLASGEDAS